MEAFSEQLGAIRASVLALIEASGGGLEPLSRGATKRLASRIDDIGDGHEALALAIYLKARAALTKRAVGEILESLGTSRLPLRWRLVPAGWAEDATVPATVLASIARAAKLGNVHEAIRRGSTSRGAKTFVAASQHTPDRGVLPDRVAGPAAHSRVDQQAQLCASDAAPRAQVAEAIAPQWTCPSCRQIRCQSPLGSSARRT